MMSKALAFALIAGGCVIAAATGAYVAVRQNAAEPATIGAPAPEAPPASQPVSETEAVVQPPAAAAAPERTPEAVEKAVERPAAPAVRETPRRERAAPTNNRTAQSRTNGSAPASAPAAFPPPERATPPSESVPSAVAESPAEPRASEPLPPPQPQWEEVVIPASSVIGLQVTTPLSSERSQIEDRVEARVTRDVIAADRLAIPAGSRVIGSVTVVERGGKMKERARLGVRFHTLVLADGREVALRTEGIFREGESPSGESARKIGGAAIGGAILGAIVGGGKGAVIGGATGAAGGTAVVMSGDRNAATLPSGTVVTVRLTAPATIEVRKN